jgi:hypothetical protein
MNSTAAAETQPASRKYSSPPHALIWFFRKSRDNWKRKYLAAKAELKRVCRRLDRRDQAKASCPPCVANAICPDAAESTVANPPQSATSGLPVACLIDFLHQQCLVRQQQVEHNRATLQHCQQQHRVLEDLTQQINRLQQRLNSAAAPESATSPPSAPPPRPATHTAAVPPLAKTPHQAPGEPKKGVCCQRHH